MNVRGFLTLIPRERETTSDTPVRFCTTWEKERCKCHLVPIFQVGKFSRLKTAETLLIEPRQTTLKKCHLKSNVWLLLLVPSLWIVIISKMIISSQGALQSHT